MWTKNGKKLFLYKLLTNTGSCPVTASDGLDKKIIVALKGELSYAYAGGSIGDFASSTTGYCIYCGSGDTPPTENDYTLAEPLSLTYISSSLTDTTINKVIQYIVRNDNAEAVTIRELGLCACNTGVTALINRKLLDTPITLEVGDQAIITYTIDTFNILDGEGWTNNMRVYACNQFIEPSTKGVYIDVNNNEIEPNATNFVTGPITKANYNTYNNITTSNSGSQNRYRFSLFCGQGTTAATPSDYTLETPVVLTCQDITNTFDDNYGELITFTLQNTSTEAYTISEICLAIMMSSGKYIVLNRKLLPTPVVMEPNDSYVFTYTINTSNLSE